MGKTGIPLFALFLGSMFMVVKTAEVKEFSN